MVWQIQNVSKKVAASIRLLISINRQIYCLDNQLYGLNNIIAFDYGIYQIWFIDILVGSLGGGQVLLILNKIIDSKNAKLLLFAHKKSIIEIILTLKPHKLPKHSALHPPVYQICLHP